MSIIDDLRVHQDKDEDGVYRFRVDQSANDKPYGGKPANFVVQGKSGTRFGNPELYKEYIRGRMKRTELQHRLAKGYSGVAVDFSGRDISFVFIDEAETIDEEAMQSIMQGLEPRWQNYSEYQKTAMNVLLKQDGRDRCEYFLRGHATGRYRKY